jgi:ribosomal protein S18 acetylase RimI-like enzyme
MEIRILTAEDANEWWKLRRQALESDPEAFSASSDEHQQLSLEDVRMRLGVGSEDSFVVGALEDGRCLAMAGFYRETGAKTRHKGRIWGVYVTPEKRRGGIGRKLLERLLERARAIDGLEQIHLSVTSTQAAAAQLYRSLGFEPFGVEPRALKIGGRHIDEEYMLLRLK